MRNNRIDWLVLLAASGVVAIHAPVYCAVSPFWKEFAAQGFCGVAVYLFFTVSGFFLAKHVEESGWWKSAVVTRVRSLLVPYLIWCSVYALLQFALGERDVGIVRILGLNPAAMPYFYPFWFVRNLFILVLISPALVITIKNRGGGLVLFSLAALSLGASLDAHLIPAGVLINSVFYFCVGLALRLKSIRLKLPRWGSIVLIATGLILFALQAWNRTALDSFVLRYLPLAGVGAWSLMVGLWGVMPNKAIPKVFEGVTFQIYALHVFLLMAIAPWVESASLTVVFTFAGCVAIAHVLKRFAPRVAGGIFGGR